MSEAKAANVSTQFQPKNQFWKMRSSHGRDAIFTEPDLLWSQATEYFDWCDTNPLYKVEYHGKNATKCDVPVMRAYTYSALCNFLGCDIKTFHNLRTRADFLPIYTRICQIIYAQKFEGAAAGLFNPVIISRDLGLTEKTDVNVSNKVKIVIKKAQPLQLPPTDVTDGEISQ